MRNKYAGKCFRCGAEVPAGKGYFQRMFGRWAVRCMACVGKGNDFQPPAKRPQNEPVSD